MNRLHKFVVFHPLKPEELDEVLESELGNIEKRMLDSTMRRASISPARRKPTDPAKKP
jgi:ATP-dependent Clp protease ATP-binding subunit ClpA